MRLLEPLSFASSKISHALKFLSYPPADKIRKRMKPHFKLISTPPGESVFEKISPSHCEGGKSLPDSRRREGTNTCPFPKGGHPTFLFGIISGRI
jgi:hypothetical protein